MRAALAIGIVSVLGVAALSGGCASPEPAPLERGTGGVRGLVEARPRTGVRAPKAADPADPYAAPAPGARFERVDYRGLEDIVVFLAPERPGDLVATPNRHPPAEPVPLTLTERGFSDRVVALIWGADLELRNASGRAVTLFSVTPGMEFEAALPAGTADRPAVARRRIPDAGALTVLVDERPDLSAEVLSAPSPWFARLRSGDRFEFANVSPRKYRLCAWHPRLPQRERPVTVSQGAYANGNLTLSVDGLPAPPGAK